MISEESMMKSERLRRQCEGNRGYVPKNDNSITGQPIFLKIANSNDGWKVCHSQQEYDDFMGEKPSAEKGGRCDIAG